ncbi:hypothetical protein GCM10022257_08320 [Hyunsoonleella aestuarii]|uniref:Uncharacterized protein n=1 Tax=Hyunsoonleella aestuarii TaxID=912802 RepID=A0ABP8E912_9FLAO
MSNILSKAFLSKPICKMNVIIKTYKHATAKPIKKEIIRLMLSSLELNNMGIRKNNVRCENSPSKILMVYDKLLWPTEIKIM